MSKVQADNLPAELRESGLFCCWRYEQRDGKQTKVPYNPRTGGKAQSTNPATFALLSVALEALERVGLSKRVKHKPTEMSGGQQQRVAIARAIATKPPIIMADEPTGALDSRTGHEVLEFLQQLNREGTTVILITHDNGIAATARRCVRLTDGKIVEDKEQEVDWF